MADFGYYSQKIRGRIDDILCRSLSKRAKKLPAGRYVSLCFDAFPQSAAMTAAPMIEQLGWRATWYVSGGFMGRTEPHYGTMFTEADLKRLIDAGHDIGCHTFDHVNCAETNELEILAQCERNTAFLNARGVTGLSSFAFPFGASNLTSKKLLASSGLALRGVKPGLNRGHADLNMLRACGLQENQGGTLRALEEALLAFPGCVLVISHDRWFLDRIATHILAYEDDGNVVFHEGNFSDYEEDHHARLGTSADQPQRVKYRKLK